jgi:hypothetical protein
MATNKEDLKLELTNNQSLLLLQILDRIENLQKDVNEIKKDVKEIKIDLNYISGHMQTDIKEIRGYFQNLQNEIRGEKNDK